jgi:hypothetical protein
MIDPIFAGAAAGIAANEAQRRIDKHIHQDIGSEGFFAKLDDMHDALRVVAQYFRSLDEPPVDKIITLQLDPSRVRLATLGRRNNMIFVPNGTTQITANIPGIGPVTFTPAIGWTELNFREGTELYLASGNPQGVIYRCTNIPLGANVI